MPTFLLRDTTTNALTLVEGTPPFVPPGPDGNYAVRAVSDEAETLLVKSAASAPGTPAYISFGMRPNGDIVVASLPSGTVTGLEISINGGAAVALSGATAGTYSTAATPGQWVRLRGLNGATPGEWSLPRGVPVVFDNFTGTNQALELRANWAQNPAGNWTVVNGAVEATTTSARQAWRTDAAASLQNCRVEFDVLSVAASSSTFMAIARHPVGGNGLGDHVGAWLSVGGNRMDVYTRVGETNTVLGTETLTGPSAPLSLACEVQGNTLRAFLNGVQYGGDQTQTAFTAAGRPGFRAFRASGTTQASQRITNFAVIPL